MLAIFHLAILVVSVIVLIKSADHFVDSSSGIAKMFGISDFIIGLTLVAIGTSLPEFASSVVASLKGEAGIAIGNVLGSNIANILLVLGVAAMFAGMRTKREMLDRDGMILVFASIVFYWLLVLEGFSLFMANPSIIRLGGVLLILMFFSYLGFLMKSGKHYSQSERFEEFVKYFMDVGFLREAGVWLAKKEISRLHKRNTKRRVKSRKNKRLWHYSMMLVLSCAGIVLGARFFIGEAIWVADMLGVSGGVVGMTLVALGTSLPELTVSVVAAKKGMGNMVIGNIIGSNIANILFVGGAALLIAPVTLARETLLYTVPFVVFTSVLLLVFIRTGWQIKKSEGFVFLMLYAVFLMLIYKGVII